MALHQGGRLAEARQRYQAVLRIDRKNADAYQLLGVLEAQSGAHLRAAELIAKAISLNPGNAAYYYNHGAALQALGRFDEAVRAYDRALKLKPDATEAYNNRGNALQALNRYDEALASYDKALALQPRNAQAHNNRGNALQALERFQDAIECYDYALALRPDYAVALFSRGNALRALGRFDEAIESYSKTIASAPANVDAYNNRGLVRLTLGAAEASLVDFEAALVLAPDRAEVLHNRGNALHLLHRFEGAAESFRRALQIEPSSAETCINLGNALHALGRFDEAVACFDSAILQRPSRSDAHADRGLALQELKRFDEAIESYDRALALDAGNAEAWNNRGVALQALQRLEDALASYRQAFALKPDMDFLFGALLYTKMRLCDWSSFESDLATLQRGIESGRKITPPFAVLGALDDPGLQRRAAQIWLSAANLGATANTSWVREPHDKIRVGYYSADFEDHATMHLMAQLFEEHDRERFEFYGISFGANAEDGVRRRLMAAFHEFVDVRARNDREVAEMSRRLGIDIAVDLKGFTKDSRPGIFVERCAPIQVNYLGYPGTVGGDFLDYIIADRVLIPAESQQHFSEKVVYLPECYQPNDTTRRISDRAFSRTELGLPETGFVFCCFNNTFKILPETFDRWMRILQAVDGSVLWLLQDSPSVQANLAKEAAARGVDERRLVFAPRLPMDQHLARQRLADLFLDTLPCNAHTTASDALWVGLPVLTRIGHSFAGRVAASLLQAVGLPELVTSTPADYEATAVSLATNPEKIAALKRKLELNRASSSLFDARKTARGLEACYAVIHSRRLRGLAPESMEIEAQT
ncbi:MAG: tetratricopeptide repeat protein [Proteobacteria bacterium]|nr:tetratricopeptide repeat protein [Pseudomonadota bacterium]